MSVKVLSIHVPKKYQGGALPYGPVDNNGLRRATEDFELRFVCNVDGVVGSLIFGARAGMGYNGASNRLGWPIKMYYDIAEKDSLGTVHDIGYAHGGEVEGLSRKLAAGEVDDVLRGGMRCTGFSRFEAGVVDRAVRIPLVHALHFGKKRDKERMHYNSSIRWVPGYIDEPEDSADLADQAGNGSEWTLEEIMKREG